MKLSLPPRTAPALRQPYATLTTIKNGVLFCNTDRLCHNFVPGARHRLPKLPDRRPRER